MWREPDEIISDLQSADGQRVSDGLRDLEEAMDSGADEFPLAALKLDILAPFGEQLPEEVFNRMLRLLDGYQSFDPKQSDADKYGKIGILGSRWGEHKKALQAALVVKRAGDPPSAAKWALEALAQGHIDTPRSLEGTQYFVSLLLDGTSGVRQATLDVLASWPRRPPFSDVVTYVRPQLDSAEAAALGV